MSYAPEHINASQEIVIDSVERYSAIERYPHVMEKLQLFWGYPEFLDYLKSIIEDDRNRVRNGFPIDVINELVFLYNIYLDEMESVLKEKLTESQIISLNEKLKKNDIWSGNFGR